MTPPTTPPTTPEPEGRELLPCPFCGAKDGMLVQEFTRATDDFAYWSVECLGCACEIVSDASQDEADAAWNTRAHTQSLAAEVEALRGENARLREALEPFAAYHGSDLYLASDAPDDGLCAGVSFRKGDYLRARAILREMPSPGGGDR